MSSNEHRGNVIQRLVAAGEVALWVLLYLVLVLLLVPPAWLAVAGVLTAISILSRAMRSETRSTMPKQAAGGS